MRVFNPPPRCCLSVSCPTCMSYGTLSVRSLLSSSLAWFKSHPEPPDDTIARKVNGSDASSFAEICGCCPSQGKVTPARPPHRNHVHRPATDERASVTQCGASSGLSSPSPSSPQASSSASPHSRCASRPSHSRCPALSLTLFLSSRNPPRSRPKTPSTSCPCPARAAPCSSCPRTSRRWRCASPPRSLSCFPGGGLYSAERAVSMEADLEMIGY